MDPKHLLGHTGADRASPRRFLSLGEKRYVPWLVGLGRKEVSSPPRSLVLGTEASGPAQPSYPVPGM